jgi:hypothetical protein
MLCPRRQSFRLPVYGCGQPCRELARYRSVATLATGSSTVNTGLHVYAAVKSGQWGGREGQLKHLVGVTGPPVVGYHVSTRH